ncbi:BZ3500_MvSof-1268-A1-R1_Chr3-3g06561 [Microbotryum saponariae]|uniref:BZ3500_MvSof-1268-A1-R1_Chr3-3g06561 protein n=1 Tax=Microbotryum saponariae TaxID=289078 RepID=A0A2X0KVN0_9BASI|nr:BZ3500_MvSof-1268-A1-R1_Chr3-3g06561 [Microbotryum saponariae]SDA04528.1 BZ3501_MvSof-1269-A2-R1_Chr3-2g06248 [Microbotryum saponariae]
MISLLWCPTHSRFYFDALRGKHPLDSELTQGCSHVHDEIVQGYTRASYGATLNLHI